MANQLFGIFMIGWAPVVPAFSVSTKLVQFGFCGDWSPATKSAQFPYTLSTTPNGQLYNIPIYDSISISKMRIAAIVNP